MPPVPAPSHLPCPDCGAAVRRGEALEHECDPDRRVEYELLQLRDELDAFDDELAAFLDSPMGRFARYLAERDRSDSA